VVASTSCSSRFSEFISSLFSDGSFISFWSTFTRMSSLSLTASAGSGNSTLLKIGLSGESNFSAISEPSLCSSFPSLFSSSSLISSKSLSLDLFSLLVFLSLLLISTFSHSFLAPFSLFSVSLSSLAILLSDSFSITSTFCSIAS